MREQRFSVVVPTTALIGRLADSFALADRAALDLHEIVVVDDRPGFPEDQLRLPELGPLEGHVRVIRTGGRGAAGARNAGWRSTSAPWVVFLDDDADISPAWADELVASMENGTSTAFRRESLDKSYGFDERPAPEPGPSKALAIAAGVTATGLLVRRLRLPALVATAGLGAAALLTVPRPNPPWPPQLRAVLFDRDGTLIHDVPYNGDPAKVEAVVGAREAIEAARAAGLKVGVVSNQSGVARGLITREQVDAVNARVRELVGPIDTWQICPHGPDDGCACRKPAPALIQAAARELGVQPYECGFIGDLPSDAAAAYAAGARPILVPSQETDDGIAETAGNLVTAVTRLINR